MSNAITRLRLPLRMLAGVFGLLLLAFLMRRTGTSMLRESIAAIGWGLSLVIALTGVSHVLKTWAWRITLLDEKRHVSFSRMFGLRLGSEAAGQLGFLGQMFGENLRVALLSSTIPPADRIASVTLDRAFFVLSAAIVTTAGLVMMLFVAPLPRALTLYASLFASILLGVLLAAVFAVRERWAVFSGTAELVGRVPYFRAWIDRKRTLICSVEHKLHSFYHQTPGAFWGSLSLNLACQGAAVLEVYLILWLVGAKISILASLAMEGLTKLVNLLGVFNPGNIGTYEGGNKHIGNMFSFRGVVGLCLGLTRRVRAIFWAAVGCVCLTILAKSRQHSSNEGTEIPTRPSPATPIKASRSHVAIILAHDLPCSSIRGSRLPQVGALPVLLRAILGAQKAGAVRIAVVLHPATRSVVVRDLQSTGRLPRSIEWYELETKDSSLPALLGQVGGEEQRVVLIAGERTYHPSLHRRAAEWNQENDVWAPITDTELAGIYSLSRNVTIDLAKHAPSSIESIEELHAWLTPTHSVECERASALARNDPGLLTRSYPLPAPRNRRPMQDALIRLRCSCPRANRGVDADRDEDAQFAQRQAFGLDDIDSRTPYAEHLAKMLFSVWVTLTEHKWVTLGERRGASERGRMATRSYSTRAPVSGAETESLARQTDRWNLCTNESQSFDPNQPPDHPVSDHTQYGQSVYSRRRFQCRCFLRIRGLREYASWRNSLCVCKHSRWMRR